MKVENRIDYIEIPVADPARARDFFVKLFGWCNQEWGPDYISFNDGQLDGGFCRSDQPASSNGALIVFYSENLKRDRARVVELGATISKDIFSFPGGQRFQFIDPEGNEFSFWSAGATDH